MATPLRAWHIDECVQHSINVGSSILEDEIIHTALLHDGGQISCKLTEVTDRLSEYLLVDLNMCLARPDRDSFDDRWPVQLSGLLALPAQHSRDGSRIQKGRPNVEKRRELHGAVRVLQDRGITAMVVAITECEIQQITPYVLAKLCLEIGHDARQLDEHLTVLKRMAR